MTNGFLKYEQKCLLSWLHCYNVNLFISPNLTKFATSQKPCESFCHILHLYGGGVGQDNKEK